MRSLPENSAASDSGSGWPASDSAASRRPAAHPSVRPCSSAGAASDRSRPAASSSAARLVEREAEIGRADLGQLGFQAQPVQAQPEVVAAGDHEAKLGRRAHQEQLELAQRLWRAQLVQVVDHEPDTVLERRQVLQQPLDDPSAVEGRRRRESPHGGRGAAERVDHRDPEPLRVALLVPDRHPRHCVREPRVSDPRPDEQCLAAPRGRRDRNDPACPLEPLEQRAAKNDPVRHGSGLGGACGEGAFHTTVSQLRRVTATPRSVVDLHAVGSSRIEAEWAGRLDALEQHLGRTSTPITPSAKEP